MGSCITSVTRYRQFAAPVTLLVVFGEVSEKSNSADSASWISVIQKATEKEKWCMEKRRNTQKFTEVDDSDDNI